MQRINIIQKRLAHNSETHHVLTARLIASK